MLIPVAGVVLYRDGKALMQHRDDRPDIVYPGAWAIFGGHLEPGEEPESGARREVEEEIGYRIDGPLELIYDAVDGDRHRIFYAAPLHARLEELTLTEGQGMALLSAAELATLPVVPLHREIVLDFLRSRA